VIVENPKAPRAERFSTIVDLGLAAWGRRWPLYLAVAAASIAIEFTAARLARFDPLWASIVLSCVDGFATAFVSLDVAARFAGDERPLRDIARAAMRRWPLVSLVLLAILFVEAPAYVWVFGTPDETLYGILILPALTVVGTFGITSVVASIDTSMPPIALAFYAFYRSLIAAAAWPNLGRVTIAGAMVAVPLMLQQLLQQWFTERGFGAGPAFFWANVPIDALCVAPFQAFFTYLYLDFTVREQRR
jgi:hypothetical protein